MSDAPKLFRQLDDDWNAQSHSGAAKAALRRWAEREPVLATYEDLPQVVTRCQRRDDDDREREAILAAVLAHAGGDAWSARTVLQALLPGLARVCKRAAVFVGGRWPVWQSLDELDQHVVVVAYERIAALARPRRCG